MTYRVPLLVAFHGAEGRRVAALRKRRNKCSVCRHRHGASRNHPPMKCGCWCSHMVAWKWVNPPWESPALYPPTLPVHAKRLA